MALLSEAFTGERVVVALFLSRILYSVPVQLLSAEALVVFFLAVAAVAIEISADRSPAVLLSFRTRPGASSGIFLGAVTLPAVVLARLIQLSRHDAGNEEFAYMRMHYWAVSMSCIAILIYVYLTLSKYTSNSPSMLRIFLIVCLGLYFIVSYLSLTKGSHVKILWFIYLGGASVGLMCHILHTFSSCASIGEAHLVSSGLVAYFGDMMASTLPKVTPVSLFLLPDYARLVQKSEISAIIQGLLSGLLLLSLCYTSLLRLWDFSTKSIKSESQQANRRKAGVFWHSMLFYALFCVMIFIIAPTWMHFVKDFQVHPIQWMLYFLFTDPTEKLLLCLWWISIVSPAVFWFYSISKHSKTERILLRKYYHLLAVVMFSPALVIQPKFLDLSFGVALSAFVALEMIRVWKILPFGQLIDRFMNAFTDHRDSDILIISHFSLLLGCALPKWLSCGFGDRPLAPFAGILSLGIGDTMASVVGHKYGTLRWSKSGKKTIEGTAAGITSVLVSCSLLLSLIASKGYILSQHWFSLLLAVTISGLLEAYTMQLDNAFIPLIFYSLLCL